MSDTLPAFPFGRRKLEIKSGRPWDVRDVALIDFARHVAMKTPFDLGTIQVDTNALCEALKAEADEMGLPLDRQPTSADFDALSPFAFAWARTRAAARATENRS